MIETILAALAVGTVWFYIILAIASIIFIACIENEHYETPAVVSVILAILYWKAFTAFSLASIALVVGGYAVAGVLWSVYRWYRFVQKTAFEFREEHGNVLDNEDKESLKYRLKVSNHKSNIIGWIAYWPWSLLWNITGDFFNMLYDAMVNAYQHIADRALNGFTIEEPKSSKKSSNTVTDDPSWRNR